jgi:hypothetical protein
MSARTKVPAAILPRAVSAAIVNLMKCLVFGLPLAAAAQQNVAKGTLADIQYCHALAKSYSKLWPNQEAMPVADAITLERCDSDPQATIATLERMSKDQKIALPPREGVAQPPGSSGNAPQRQQ